MTGTSDLAGGTVTREFIEGYTTQLDMLGDEAEDRVLARLGDVAQRWLEMREEGKPVEEIVAYLEDEAGATLMDNDKNFGTSSASLAINSLYDEGNEHGLDLISLKSTDVFSVIDEYSRKSNRASAKHWAEYLDGTAEGFDRFLGGICAKTRRNVIHAADRSMVAIAQSLGAKDNGVRYARVPQGPSCGFCMMLASRGFVYVSKESAGAFTRFHDHCDCHVVAGRKGIEVEGYHPEIYLNAYARCRDTLGGNDRVWEDFCALTPEERDKFGHGELLPVFEDKERQEEFWRKYGRNANAFNDYYTRRIVAEMDTRDREWVYTGKPTPIDYSEKPREKYGVLIDPAFPISERYTLSNITGKDNEKKDVFVHDMLSGNGFRVQVHETIENGGFTNIDLDLNGNRCEAKSPQARRNPGSKDELKFVQRNVQSARHQFAKETSRCESRMVMSNYYTEFEGEKEELVIDRYRKELNLQGFTEGLFIRKDGSIVRVK